MGRDADLEGKVAIVTGAGSRAPGGLGHGRAAAMLLASVGARVLLVDQVEEWVEDTAEMLRSTGGTAAARSPMLQSPKAAPPSLDH